MCCSGDPATEPVALRLSNDMFRGYAMSFLARLLGVDGNCRRRSRAFSGSALAADRPIPRGARARSQRRSRRAGTLLLWEREWWRVGDARCGPDLAADLRL